VSKIAFYDSRAWHKLRSEVLRDDHCECQICRNKYHRHRKAEIVHHVYHLDEYPEYGLCRLVKDKRTGELVRNLISVCRECHETECHPERMRVVEKKFPLTDERW